MTNIYRGAINIPLSDLENRIDELDKSKTIIVYCKSGGRSRTASETLAQHDFIVYNMLGGINAWKEKFATSVSPSVALIIEDAKVGKTSITLIHHGGDTIVESFKNGNWHNLEVKYNGVVIDTSKTTLNGGALDNNDFKAGDELAMVVPMLSSGDVITVIYTPTGDILQKVTVAEGEVSTLWPTPAPATLRPIPVVTPPPGTPTLTPISKPVAPPPVTPTPALPVLPISPEYFYLIPIALLLILLPLIFYARGKRKKTATTSPEKPLPSSPEQKVKKEQIISPLSEPITIGRAIYDPCKRDFIEGRLPKMKEWINRYDAGAYWFVISIQNNTDRAIEEWGVELETSSALKVEKAIIEGIDYKIELRETYPEPYKNRYAIGVPKEYGIVIPKGGAQRVYFKLRAEKPKTVYEISGVFKSVLGEVPIRAKEFKYLCDAGVSAEAVKAELKKTFSEKDAARLSLAFKIVQELDRMCNQEAKTEEYLDKLSVLKNYTEGFSDMFTNRVKEFARFMKQEQLGYLDDEYKGKVRRFCTNLIDVWISEFLKG